MKKLKNLIQLFALFCFIALIGCESENIPLKIDQPETLALLKKCPEITEASCPNPCQFNCSVLNDLFGVGNSPGNEGILDEIINCPPFSIQSCDYFCPTVTKRSGNNAGDLPWVDEWLCESGFNNSTFPLCKNDGKITEIEQQQLIDAAELIAQNNGPTASCGYKPIYDFFWERVTENDCENEWEVHWVIGVEIKYVPTLCNG